LRRKRSPCRELTGHPQKKESRPETERNWPRRCKRRAARSVAASKCPAGSRAQRREGRAVLTLGRFFVMTGLHPRHRLIQSILVALFLGGPLAACSRSKEPETAAAQDPVAPEAGLGAGRRAEGGPVAREPAPAAPRSADAKPKAKGDAKLAQRAVGERDPAVATSMPERESEEDAMSPGWNRQDFNTEGYDHLVENRFVSVASAPLSTFSIDVD